VLTELKVQHKRAGLILFMVVSAWVNSAVIKCQCSLGDYPKKRTTHNGSVTFVKVWNADHFAEI